MTLLSPVSGCFSALGNLGGALGGSRPAGAEKAILVSLDVVTFPVQLIVLGPPLLCEYIDANIGERGRRKREAELHQKAVAEHTALLDADLGVVYTNADFLCSTNRAAMEALNVWFSAYGIHKVPRETITPYAEFVLARPELLQKVRSLWRQPEIPAECRRRAFDAGVKMFRTGGDEDSLQLATELLGKVGLSDDEVKALADVSDPEDRLAKAAHRELDERVRCRKWEAERKERERKEREERLAREKEEAARRLKEAEERHRQWMAHREQMRVHVKSLEGSLEELRPALAWCRDEYVADCWDRRLWQRQQPLPVENLRLLAETLLSKKGKEPHYMYALMSRTEFMGNDLRRYYDLLLERMREGWAWGIGGKLVRNPNTPEDVVAASYDEPLLVELRYTYVFHQLYKKIGRVELQQLQRRHDEVVRDPKLSLEQRNRRLMKEVSRFMPKTCPADWRSSAP